MQLRNVCSHPFLFVWAIDQAVLGEENASGIDRLLRELFKRVDKVLLIIQPVHDHAGHSSY